MWTARGVQPLAGLGHSPLASTKMKFLVSDPMKFIGFPIISCLVYIYIYILPKFNIPPEELHGPNGKVVFQPPFFRGYVKLRGCVYIRNTSF